MFGGLFGGSKPAPESAFSEPTELDAGPTDFSGASSSFQSISDSPSAGGDAELQRILMKEQQRAQFQAQVHSITLDSSLCLNLTINFVLSGA